MWPYHNRQADAAPTERPTILVELFTSEGCSSCPPADALLATLAQPGPDDRCTVVPLEFHVDYWNDLGWKDPFSKPTYTQRQYAYGALEGTNRVYTPQMVVDGTNAFVGSNRHLAQKAIRDAASKPKASLDVTNVAVEGESVSFRLAGRGLTAGESPPDVLIAITEDGLQTDVPRGENAGTTLRHTGVVRTFKKIGVARADGSFQYDVKLPLEHSWHRRQLHIASFVQDPRNGCVLAVVSVPLAQ